jgi:hypothetical protein
MLSNPHNIPSRSVALKAQKRDVGPELGFFAPFEVPEKLIGAICLCQELNEISTFLFGPMEFCNVM